MNYYLLQSIPDHLAPLALEGFHKPGSLTLASGAWIHAAGAFVRIPHEGYGANDAFYEGVGRYSPIFTCNTWANSALKACDQKCCLWTALSPPIFWKYPLEKR